MKGTILLLGVVAVLLVSGCAQTTDTAGTGGAGDTQPSDGGSQVTKTSTPSASCEENAKSLVPDSIEMYRGSMTTSWKFTEDNEWTDGSAMMFPSNFLYKAGSEAGQNTDYYYLEHWGDKFDDITYSSGTRTFTINPVLVKVQGTETEGTTSEGKIYKAEFRIVDYGFVSCSW
jgi:hypothetical protein